jgi:uncharacterized damage-inducible protein DinB
MQGARVSIAASLFPEFDLEMANLRRALQRVPEASFSWKPHEKSMTLGRLATHLSEIPFWAVNVCTESELDVAPPGAPPFAPQTLATTGAILAQLDRNVTKARAAISATSDAAFTQPWTLKAGGKAISTQPRLAVYRSLVMNHMIHHRGQLSVFLRLAGAKVPAVYGPSADEQGGGQ